MLQYADACYGRKGQLLPLPPLPPRQQDGGISGAIRDVPIFELGAVDAILFPEAQGASTSEVASSSGCCGTVPDGAAGNNCCYDIEGYVNSPFSSLTCLDPASIAVLLEDDPNPDAISAYSSSTSVEMPPPPQLQVLPGPSPLTYLDSLDATSDPNDTAQFDLLASLPDVALLLLGNGSQLSSNTAIVPSQISTPTVFRDDECAVLSEYLALPDVLPDTVQSSTSYSEITDPMSAARLGVVFPGPTHEMMFQSSESQLQHLIGSTVAEMEVLKFYPGRGFYRNVDYGSAMRRAYSCADMQVMGDVGHHMEAGEEGFIGVSASTTETTSSTEEKTARKISPEERKEKISRYMKKRNERNFTKKIKYACRKTLADNRPRVRGRFARNDDFGEVALGAQSYTHDDDEDSLMREDDMLDSSDLFAQLSSFKCNYTLESWI